MHQGEEVLRPRQPRLRECLHDVAVRPSLGDHRAQQVEVAVQLPPGKQQVAQLAVVDAHVGVDQAVGSAFVGKRVPQVVEHHVGVVDGVLGGVSEPVAVVPLAHDVQRRFDVLVEHAQVPIRLHYTPHFGLGETEHLVELGPEAQVGADVETARYVVQGDRRDPGDEQPFHAAVLGARLERREEAAVEAAAAGKRVVRLRSCAGEDRAGKVVVLVDQDVERNLLPAGVQEQLVELAVDGGRGLDAVDHRIREEVGMILYGVPDVPPAVLVELPFQVGRVIAEGGEVEPHDHVAAAVRGRLPVNVQAAEHPLEVVRLIAVVVALQHRQPAGLAEAPRADEEHEALLLQARAGSASCRRTGSPPGGCP